MDPRSRADELLARARARGAFVVTPDNMTSPMDASSTVRIPRATIAEASGADPDSTMVISTAQYQTQQPVPQQDVDAMWPQTDHQASYQDPGRGERTSLYAALTPDEPQQGGEWGQQYPHR